ncbi:hypothetical protein FisN_14Lh382 [Fistulifera solaris]|uniref:Uncharacterized protein n=1 Tax=Fistulifera solaris TaxID=1519565 RepID=A0A1Z5JHX9_FISSO|nr:hypothetical protein FisN_14Lh382 [Fistulifera solaris]|eukprot:GAX13609.1 hypothetical protein FisN_14Lh382 [Fistulifera solaris]
MNNPYRAAIYLNNVAVTLLKGGCSLQALNTLRDAVQIVSSICSKELLESSLVNATLMKAAQRLANPVIDHGSLSKKDFTVIAEDTLVYSNFKFALQGYYVVHIDSLDQSRSNYEQDQPIECATVLYNLGMTYELLNTQCPIEALVGFSLAYSLLEPTIQKWLEGSLPKDKNRIDECDWCSILLIGFLSLQKLKAYSLQIGIDEDHATSILEIMKFAIIWFQKTDSTVGEVVAAAA